ncbi:MAG TPA: CCA tRNA nucleotidyltransferase [Rhodospirillaceae bacterium]|nr:CCA tRNA nucleotidyltransferase [Rhodospirillaceae bacterium]
MKIETPAPFLSHLLPEQNPWTNSKALQALLYAVRGAGGDLRIVGGAVRDVAAGRPVQDIDLAGTLPPQELMAALAKADIKAVPTGIDHGTITAVYDHRGYEITTLRRDVETDGRRAKVAFTDDWQVDASRRDLTFNALYLDENGVVYDYFGGLDDLQDKIIRLIGDPVKRIKEDALRILRVFRFFAQLSDAEASVTIDPQSLEACAALAPMIQALSAERLWKEMAALLKAEGCVAACTLMVEQGVMAHFLPDATNGTLLRSLLLVEPDFGLKPCPVRRLASLLEGVADVSRLRLSKQEQRNLDVLCILPKKLVQEQQPNAAKIRQHLYDHGAETVKEAYALVVASGGHFDLKVILPVIEAWQPISFPLRGEDLLKNGMVAGRVVGDVLRETERWWRGQDFAPDHAACLAQAMAFLADLGQKPNEC